MNLQDRFKRKGVREQLEPLLDATGISWGQYVRNKEKITQELIDKKKILTLSPKFLGLTYSKPPPQTHAWQANRVVQYVNKIKDDQLVLIPPKTTLFRNSPGHTTLKKGALFPVRFHADKHTDLRTTFAQRIQQVSQDKRYYGWDFEGVDYSKQEFRTVLLYDHIRAQIALETFEKGTMHVRPFCDYKPAKGIIVVRNMPSFETGEVYPDFVIEGVVLEDLAKAHPKRTFDFSSNHSCDKTTYAKVKFGRDFYSITGDMIYAGREGKEEAIDHHVILAMHIAKQDLAAQGINIYNPFVKAKPETVAFFDKLHHNVLADYLVDDEPITRSPLDIPDIETLLWNHVAYENNQAEQKAKKKANNN